MRWEQQKGLPVHRVPGGQRNAVFAFRVEIDEWLRSGNLDSDSLGGVQEISPIENASNSSAAEVVMLESLEHGLIEGNSLGAGRTWLWSNRRRAIWSVLTIFVLGFAAYEIRSLASPRLIQFTGVVQLTNDGMPKRGLVTDGKTLYFGEYRDGKAVLASVSIEGGLIHAIPTPFLQVFPEDISPDGKNLLVLVGEGVEEERALWVVPIFGGEPRRIGNFLCHAAVWSSDGRKIAFAEQNAIYVANNDERSIQQVEAFDSIPETLRWSLDGLRLRVELSDRKSATLSFWEIVFRDSSSVQVSDLIPLQTGTRTLSDGSMTLDGQGRSFISSEDSADQRIFLLERDREFWSSHFDMQVIKSPLDAAQSLTLDSKSQRVFAIGGPAVPEAGGSQGEDLLWFDRDSKSFRPFLPGISAEFVDFSKNGTLMAYVRTTDRSLWISRSDGTNGRQVDFQAIDLELPRWSPDGRWIAFTAKLPYKPWRIFVVSVTDGKPREAGVGTDSQGAPTWSPDGKWLVYGNVECQKAGVCAIHKIDLSTGREVSVPGSEGLGTARWSPDGRHIAALNPDRHEVLVFDVATERWRTLDENVNGNDLSWSSDSRFLFASKPTGNQPEILRISLKDAKVDTAIDLSTFAKLRGRFDTWFALTPDGSIVLSHQMNSNEIYSLAYKEN